MTKYRYTRPETMELDDYHEFQSNFDKEDGEWLAEAAAENYHDRHDGWESLWPLVLVIRDENGSEIGTYEVDREAVPHFTVREVKK